jgi:hypothetical protein
MRLIYSLIAVVFISTGCQRQKSDAMIAAGFIDAFYSFNSDSLKLALASARGSQPEIMYYQKWAECAHYKVEQRGDFIKKNDSTISCPITVKDDLMKTLQINFNVTDTFHITIVDSRIRSVQTSSNDPHEYYMAKDWVKKWRPGYVEKPCEGIWAGGPTPCECVKGMLKGFEDYKTDAPGI